MDFVTFIITIVCIIFVCIHQYTNIVLIISVINILYLLFAVMLNKDMHITKIGAIELSISILAFIYSLLALFFNIDLINMLF